MQLAKIFVFYLFTIQVDWEQRTVPILLYNDHATPQIGTQKKAGLYLRMRIQFDMLVIIAIIVFRYVTQRKHSPIKLIIAYYNTHPIRRVMPKKQVTVTKLLYVKVYEKY